MIRNLFKTIVAAVALIACDVRAADVTATMPTPGTPPTIFNGGTNKAVALSTNGYFTINSANQTDLAFFINFSYLNAVGAGDVNALRLDLFRGITSSIFESNSWQSLTFAAGSTTTTPNSTCTNISVAGIPYLRGRLVNVSTNAHATNILLYVQPKTQRVVN